MDERGGAEAERARERAERDAAEFGMPGAEFGERRRGPPETDGLGARNRDKRQALPAEPGTDAGRDRKGAREDDVGRADREHEPQEVVVARAGRPCFEEAKGADFPRVEGDVAERPGVAFEDEEPWVTAGREMFDHGSRVSS
jgi:hypothetical protein